MPCGQFPAIRPNEPKSQSDIASRPLSKSPVSSLPHDVVPQMIIRSPHVAPGKFAIGDAKRLLQQYLPIADIAEPQTAHEAHQSHLRSNSVGLAQGPVVAANKA